LLTFASLTAPIAGEGKLEEVRQEVRDKDQSDDEDGSRARKRRGGCPAHAGCCVPPCDISCEDRDDDRPKAEGYFLPHPYACGHPGYMLIDPHGGCAARNRWDKNDPFADARPWAGRVSLEEGNDFDGLNRVRGHLLLEATCGLGVETSWSYLHERLGGGRTDDLLLGDVNLLYRVLEMSSSRRASAWACAS
jgi:hypothetical protein